MRQGGGTTNSIRHSWISSFITGRAFTAHSFDQNLISHSVNPTEGEGIGVGRWGMKITVESIKGNAKTSNYRVSDHWTGSQGRGGRRPPRALAIRGCSAAYEYHKRMAPFTWKSDDNHDHVTKSFHSINGTQRPYTITDRPFGGAIELVANRMRRFYAVMNRAELNQVDQERLYMHVDKHSAFDVGWKLYVWEEGFNFFLL